MPHKILVIDDDKINTSLMNFRLSEKGYTVILAKDGQEGLELVQEENPDLVFLDIHMPNMNGYKFMINLKQLEGYEGIPVIMLTANETMEDIFNLEGVKGYFVKPIEFPKVLERVIEILGKNPDS